MVKLSIAALAAATLCMSDDSGERPDPTVPWLELDTKTKLPKVHISLRHDVASIGSFVLPLVDADKRFFTNVSPTFRSI